MGRSAVRSQAAWRAFDRAALAIAAGISLPLVALTFTGHSPFSRQTAADIPVYSDGAATPRSESPSPATVTADPAPATAAEPARPIVPPVPQLAIRPARPVLVEPTVPAVAASEAEKAVEAPGNFVAGGDPATRPNEPAPATPPRELATAPATEAAPPSTPVADAAPSPDPSGPPATAAKNETAPAEAEAAAPSGQADAAHETTTSASEVAPPAEPAAQPMTTAIARVPDGPDTAQAATAGPPLSAAVPQTAAAPVTADAPKFAGEPLNADAPKFVGERLTADAPKAPAEAQTAPKAKADIVPPPPVPAQPPQKVAKAANATTAPPVVVEQQAREQTRARETPAKDKDTPKAVAALKPHEPPAPAKPKAAAVPPAATNPASVAYRKSADRIIVYGRVRDEQERAAVLKAAHDVFGGRKLVDHVTVDAGVKPVEWLGKAQEVVGLLQGLDGTGRIVVEGNEVMLSGFVTSEHEKQRHGDAASKLFGPSAKVDNRLKASP